MHVVPAAEPPLPPASRRRPGRDLSGCGRRYRARRISRRPTIHTRHAGSTGTLAHHSDRRWSAAEPPISGRLGSRAGRHQDRQRILRRQNVANTTCPDNEPVQTGHTFVCTLSIDGSRSTVTVTFVDDNGTYEVSRPS
ncbi:DUF4333 domain-containing protein [Rhodococcus sp. 2.95]